MAEPFGMVTIAISIASAPTSPGPGRTEEAAKAWKEVLEKLRLTRGDGHLDTISAMSSLATMLGDQGQLEEAARMMKEVLEKRRRILDEEHPETFKSACVLASVLQNLEKDGDAENISKQALESYEQVNSMTSDLASTLGKQRKSNEGASTNRRKERGIVTSTSLMPLDGHIRATIQSHASPKDGLYHICCKASWQILDFCQQKLDGDCNLHQVITLTNTPARTQAALCNDFVETVWDRQGLTLLDAMVGCLSDESCGKTVNEYTNVN
jgi:hypothetical protein